MIIAAVFILCPAAAYADGSDENRLGSQRGAGQEYDGVDIDSFYNTSPEQQLISASRANYTDIEDANVAEKAAMLREFGIMEGENDKFYPERAVTRAEVAEAAVRVRNADAETLAGTVNARFYDVTPEENAYVYAAAALGLVNGYPDNSFRPNTPAEGEEILKILVYAAGFGSVAEAMGGFPGGILALSAQMKLHLKMNDDRTVSRADFASLLTELLEADAARISGYDSDSGAVINYTDNVLSYYHKIYKTSGRVTMNGITSTDNSNVCRGMVTVGGTMYGDEDGRFAGFIGYNVNCWYRDDGDKYPVLYMKQTGGADTLTISCDDFIGYSDGRITYYDKNDRTRSMQLQRDFEVIKNGVYLKRFDKSIFDFKAGKMTFIKDGSASGYGLVLMEEYENFIVSAAELSGDRLNIKTKYASGDIEIDLERTVLDIYKNGSKIEYIKRIAGSGKKQYDFSAIAPDTVLSVVSSSLKAGENRKKPEKDAEYVKLYITDVRITGKITSVNGEKLRIGKNTYKLSPSNLFNGTTMILKENIESSFYLDVNGKIAGAADTGESVWRYGYLINAATDKTLNERVSFKILDTDAEIRTYKGEKRIRINDAPAISEGKKIIDALQTAAKLIKPEFSISQVIKYKLTADNTVSAVQCVRESLSSGDDGTDTLRRNCVPTSFDLYYTSAYSLYNLSKSRLEYSAPKYYFSVPKTETRDEDDYGVITRWRTQAVAKTVELYDSGNWFAPKVGVIYQDTESEGLGNGMGVFIGGTHVLDEETHEEKYEVTLLYGAGEVVYTAENDSIADGFERGDLIRAYGNEQAKILKDLKHFSYGGVVMGIGALPDINTVPGSENSRRFCEVYYRDNKRCIVQYGNITDTKTGARENQLLIYLTDNSAVYKDGTVVIDNLGERREPELRTGSFNDLRPVTDYGTAEASKVLISGLTHDLYQLVIFNGM